MLITELIPNKKIEWHCTTSTEEWLNTNISFDLEEKDGHTILRFAHKGWREETDFFDAC